LTALPHTIPVAMGARDALLYAALGVLAAGLVAVRWLLQDSPLLPWAQAGIVLLSYLLLAVWVRTRARWANQGTARAPMRSRAPLRARFFLRTGNGAGPRKDPARTPRTPTRRGNPDDDVA